MNKLSLLLIVFIVTIISCSKSDNQPTPGGGGGGGGNDTAVGSTIDIRGIITTSQTWRKDFIFRFVVMCT